jgi:S1-C subfamily serine protease
MAPPSLDGLDKQSRRWIDQSCPRSHGPHLWRACVEREAGALSMAPPSLNGLDEQSRRWIDQSCPRSHGPHLWRACVQREASALGVRTEPAPSRPGQHAPPPRTINPTVPKSDQLPKAAPATAPQVVTVTPGWTPIMAAPKTTKHAEQFSAMEVFRRVSPSVYLLLAGKSENDNELSQGSAVAVSKNFAVTNCHVVEGKSVILISGDQGSYFQATLIAADKAGDRCILEANRNLEPIPGIRSLSSLQVGEPVFSIGNPSGLTRTLGEGIISGLRRHEGLSLIQTTAPISSGSSGGALVDGQGNLVGVTTFLLRNAQNLNFAIGAEEYWRP